MADRRMFAKTIIDSDAFIDLPLSAQALYFHLSMRADDEGFVNNPRKIQRMIGASLDDLRLLLAKRFLLIFDSGIVVIKHWLIHNQIRKDRAHPTLYVREKECLMLDEKNGYKEIPVLGQPDGNQMATVCQPNDNQMTTIGQPDGNQMATEDSIGYINNIIITHSVRNNNLSGNDTRQSESGEEESEKYSAEVAEVIAYLNATAKVHYRSSTKETRKHIIARLREGYTVFDLCDVIDQKVEEWHGTQMAKYLRPKTLFGSNFESYYNDPTDARNVIKESRRQKNEGKGETT